jgi:hypothetical protein
MFWHKLCSIIRSLQKVKFQIYPKKIGASDCDIVTHVDYNGVQLMLKQVTNNTKMKRFTSRISVPIVVCEDATICCH